MKPSTTQRKAANQLLKIAEDKHAAALSPKTGDDTNRAVAQTAQDENWNAPRSPW